MTNPETTIRRRRWPLYLLGALVLLVALPAAIAAWRLEAWANAYKDRALPAVEARLGRKVTVGRLEVSLLGLAATVREVAIGPEPGLAGDRPLLAVARVRVDVAALPTLLSLGKRITVEAVEVDGMAVEAVRFTDGTTNLERLQARLDDGAESPPPGEATRERVRQARLGKLRVEDARVGFTDLARNGARVAIGDLDVAADDVGLAREWTLAVSAAVLQAQKNLDVRARLLPAPPRTDGFGAPALASVALKMGRTEIAPLVPFLAPGTALATLEAAALEADLTVERPATGATGARGTVILAGLRFPGGAPFDAALDLDARADAARGDVDVARLALRLGEMALEAQGKLLGLRSAPRFENFRLASRGLDFDAIRRHYPALDAGGVALRGPFSVEASASGGAGKQQFQVGLDLSAAAIEMPELFRKPAGTTLALRARGTAAGDAAKLEELLLEIVDWRLRVQGAVERLGSAEPALDLTAATAAPALDGLLRLLPPVARAVPSGRPLGGALAMNGTVKGTARDLTAAVSAKLSGLDLKVPDAWLRGGGELDARVSKRGDAVSAAVSMDLDRLEAIYTDVLRKTAGTPLALKLDARASGPKTAATFEAQVAALRATGRAEVERRGRDQAFDVTVEAAPFALSTVFALAPKTRPERIGHLHLGGTVRARGTSGKPASMQVTLPGFTASAGKSDVAGKLSFTNPERPSIELDATSKYLDLDDFLPPAPKAATPPPKKAGGRPPARPDDPLARITGQARLAVARGRAQGIDYQDLKADLRLADGRAVARTLEVGVFGGRFSGSGTDLPLADGAQPFTAKGKLTGIDVDAVLTRFADMPDLLRGRLSADIALSGAGTDAEALKKTLAGLLSGELAGAAFVPGTLLGGLRAPLAKAVELPGLARVLGGGEARLDPKTERALGDLATAVRFQGGAMVLQRPLAASTPHGPLSLDGRISLEGKLDLRGTWTLTPAAASRLTGNRLRIDQPLPVKLEVTGPVRAPRVVPTNAAQLAKVFAAAWARSESGKALQEGARQAAERAGLGELPAAPKVDEAKAQAAAAARAEAERARAAAEEQRVRAEEEARRRAAEAQQQVKQGAKEKLKGLLGR